MKIEAFVGEIARRGGEVSIFATPYGKGRSAGHDIPLALVPEPAGVARSGRRKVYLLRCEGWRFYSSRFGSRRAHLAYLVGRDDNGLWAVRVPGTMRSAREALEWIEPAEVKAARRAGFRTLRQGDVYAVEKRHDMATESPVPSAHAWNPETRTLVHTPGAGERPHAPLHVPWPCKLVEQRVYHMGRGGRRGGGD